MSRHRWVPLTADFAELLGIAKEATSPDAAAQEWIENGLQDAGAEQLTQNARSEYVPSEEGSEAAACGFAREWRVGNRNFRIPEECSLQSAVLHVTKYFSEPHVVIPIRSEAESWHLSYQEGAVNVQSSMVRESGDVQAAARLGAGPWQMGVLAALLLVFEIFAGAHPAEVLEDTCLHITHDHLQRAQAFLLLALSLQVPHRFVRTL